jgi:hypothetical protein
MKRRSEPVKHSAHFLTPGLLMLVLSQLLACASFAPEPLSGLDYLSRVESQEQEGVRVSVSVLTREEARRGFGETLDQKRIQPVWIQIENNSDRDYTLLLHGVDPDYFSVQEAAAASHAGSPSNRARIDSYFDSLGIEVYTPSGHSNSGFVFSNLKQGTRQVRVRLLGEQALLDFEFFVTVPGLQADWQHSGIESIYREDEIVSIEDSLELRDVLEEFMCCTTKKNGEGTGDPLNLVVISPPGGLQRFIGAGWDETEIINFGSSWRTVKAFIAGSEYKYSPISALYVFQRPQDLSLQKARDNIHERNHLRLWLTPWRYRGNAVWIGGISRDIGVFFTTRTWNLTTHAIDSQVDEARSYVLEDLATAQGVAAFSMVNGVGRATRDNPQENLLGTPWWTDGRRLVLMLSNDRISLEKMEVLDWVRQAPR